MEYHMELFVFGFDKAEDVCGGRDDPKEACTWKGVVCNDDVEVESFQWAYNYREGTGTIDFTFLPRTLKALYLPHNALNGKIKLADLPENMKSFLLYTNRLSGTLNLDTLPRLIQQVDLRQDTFTGDLP